MLLPSANVAKVDVARANKIIVGRNENENRLLIGTKNKIDYIFEVPNCGSPITILQGPKTKKAIEKAASTTAYHSDLKNQQTVNVNYDQIGLEKRMTVTLPCIKEINILRI